jgi:ubiquitin C-terminal hydrolase
VLEGDNTCYCSVCKAHKPARKHVSFWAPSLPKVLIVVLKRFEFQDFSAVMGRAGMTRREKIDSLVDFPVNGLDLAPFCGDSLSMLSTGTGDCLYDLFAVCNHYGRMGFGHYTAFARDWKAETLSDTWLSFDDNDVEICDDSNSVVSNAAYILFYRRRP